MRDWLDAIPNLGVPGVLGVKPQKSAPHAGTRRICSGVPGVPEHLPGTPAGAAIPLNNQQEYPPHPEHLKKGIVHAAPRNPSAILHEWHSHLEPLATGFVPEGMEQERWRELVDDAWWVYEGFASQLVRQGWSDLDIFGIVPSGTYLGGIIARLYGTRNLKLDGIQAVWSRNGRRDWACVGGTDCLGDKGIVRVWDLSRG